MLACRISIKHEVFRDFVSSRSLLFMELLLHNAAEDVISGAVKSSDLCLYFYLITERGECWPGRDKMFLINSLHCEDVAVSKSNHCFKPYKPSPSHLSAMALRGQHDVEKCLREHWGHCHYQAPRCLGSDN